MVEIVTGVGEGRSPGNNPKTGVGEDEEEPPTRTGLKRGAVNGQRSRRRRITQANSAPTRPPNRSNRHGPGTRGEELARQLSEDRQSFEELRSGQDG
jgi:hypothetical protein